MTAEERTAFVEKAAEGRRQSGLRGPAIARARYRAVGVPEEEIDLLMSMPQSERKWARKRFVLYGIRPSEVAAMRKTQGDRCALCDGPLPRNYHIDHDHKGGHVRGLLCPRCNLALGHVEARGPEWVIRALEYITTRGPAAD